MTPPTEKPFEPTPEQVEEVSKKLARYLATDVCPKLRQMVEWHLVQLHRETERLRVGSERDVIAKTGDLRDEALRIKADLWRSESAKEKAERDLSTLRSQIDHWKGRFENLADDALVALAGHCGTPEEGYKESPHCLSGDIQRLIREHQTQIDALKAEVAELAKDKARLDEALKLVEWAGRTEDGENWGIPTCPICEAYKASGHLDDCEIKAALTPAAMKPK